jgi:hypothetical protein
VAALNQYEGTIQTSSGNGNAYAAQPTSGSSSGYTVTAESTNGDTFSIVRTGGATTRSCNTTGSGGAAISGGCVNGSW